MLSPAGVASCSDTSSITWGFRQHHQSRFQWVLNNIDMILLLRQGNGNCRSASAIRVCARSILTPNFRGEMRPRSKAASRLARLIDFDYCYMDRKTIHTEDMTAWGMHIIALAVDTSSYQKALSAVASYRNNSLLLRRGANIFQHTHNPSRYPRPPK